MEASNKDKIYDRLLEISLKIDFKHIPNPQYINEKIGNCHVLIEEVEKFFIQVTKEMSLVQRALNNSTAAYETSRNNLISTNEEIKFLPNQKDREAKANTMLKTELNEIKGYQNELLDLENLQKVLNLKLKNLTRLNTDIKTQLKLMDSQIRLGTPPADSPAARSLAEELSKSTVGADIFAGMETTSEENNVVDPSEPLDVDALLSTSADETISTVNVPLTPGSEPEEVIKNRKEEFEKLLGIYEPEVKPDDVERSVLERLLDPMPTDPEDDITACMPREDIPNEPDSIGTVIDLDKILVPETPKTGGAQAKVEPKMPMESIHKETPKPKTGEIDIESLLSQFH